MGNTKFKFSNMIPNAWFYKLRDMGKNNRYRNTTKKTHATSSSSSSFSNSSSLFSSTDSNSTFVQHKTKQPQILHHRKSYYFTRDLSPPHLHSVIDTKLQNSPIKSPKQRKSPNSPNISQKQKIRNRVASEKGNYVIPISVDPNKGFCNAKYNTLESHSIGFDPISEKYSPNSSKLMISKGILRDNPNCQISIQSDSENSVPNSDIHNLDSNASGIYPNSKSKLPRIITKKEIKAKKEKNIITPKKQTVFTGVRLRTNSPRIGKVNESGRKSFNTGRKIPESFAVVKSSLDPKRDFRESMVEMILANDIKSSKELEDLLFCFLELNCDVYHEVIIEVFKQIWFDLVYVSV